MSFIQGLPVARNIQSIGFTAQRKAITMTTIASSGSRHRGVCGMTLWCVFYLARGLVSRHLVCARRGSGVELWRAAIDDTVPLMPRSAVPVYFTALHHLTPDVQPGPSWCAAWVTIDCGSARTAGARGVVGLGGCFCALRARSGVLPSCLACLFCIVCWVFCFCKPPGR